MLPLVMDTFDTIGRSINDSVAFHRYQKAEKKTQGKDGGIAIVMRKVGEEKIKGRNFSVSAIEIISPW